MLGVLVINDINGNLHYRRTFDLDNKNEIPEKNLLKVVNSKIWLKNVIMCGKYSLTKFANFLIIACVTCGNCYHFRLKNGTARNTN